MSPRIDIESLRRGFRGELLTLGDPGYEDLRVVWNARIDRRPVVIARCTGASDVRAAIAFAEERNLSVAVRGGGHDIAGNGVCEGGIVIDMRPMKRAVVDPLRRVVRAQAGLTWGDLDAAVAPHGLVAAGGQCSAVGIIGGTLGGGIGSLMRKYGVTVDDLLSVELVTVDGQVLRASHEENPELFWGLSGGGGNFGVVTEIELRLHPLDRFYGGIIMYPGTMLRDALRFFDEHSRRAPETVTTNLVYMIAPPAPGLPASSNGTPAVAFLPVYDGPPEHWEETLRPFRELGRPALDVCGPMPYASLIHMFDDAARFGLRQAQRSDYLGDLSDELIEVLAEHAERMPSPMTGVELIDMGGAIARVPAGATAFPGREAKFFWAVQSAWASEADDEVNLRYTRTYGEAIRPFSRGGTYPSFIDADEPAERVRESFGANWERLVALKRRYDPKNILRLNKNIEP